MSPRTLLLPLALFSLLSLPAFAHSGEPFVLFDQGHGQRFPMDGSGPLDLSKFSSLFLEEGMEPRVLGGAIDDGALAGAAGLVISGPFQSFREEESAAISKFLESGGRLVLMLHIGPPAKTLLHQLGVVVSRGVVNETDGLVQGKPLDFHVTRLEPHPLTEGLERFTVYGSWALKNSGPAAWVIARSGPRSWMDLNNDRIYTAGEPVESLGIVVAGKRGKGAFLIFSDDAIFQNQFLRNENLELARNLVKWMSGGTVKR